MAEGYAAPSILEIEYFTTAFSTSLDTLNSYMESLREHIGLLYGPEVVDRLNNLNFWK